MKRMLAASGLVVILAACGTTGTGMSSSAIPSPSATSATPATQTPANVLAASTRIARTTAGPVGYREVGAGSPLLLITGFSASRAEYHREPQEEQIRASAVDASMSR